MPPEFVANSRRWPGTPVIGNGRAVAMAWRDGSGGLKLIRSIAVYNPRLTTFKEFTKIIKVFGQCLCADVMLLLKANIRVVIDDTDCNREIGSSHFRKQARQYRVAFVVNK